MHKTLVKQFLQLDDDFLRFLSGIAKVLKPLRDATFRTGHLSWTSAMQLAFDISKSLFASAVPLHHLHPSAKLSLATDSSDTLIGAVLQQQTQSSVWGLCQVCKSLPDAVVFP
jgi:hypothetical protein